MYNCPKCDYATNSPMEFRNHLKDNHPDIENPDLAYLHAGNVLLKEIESVSQMFPYHQGFCCAAKQNSLMDHGSQPDIRLYPLLWSVVPPSQHLKYPFPVNKNTKRRTSKNILSLHLKTTVPLRNSEHFCVSSSFELEQFK